MTVEYRVTFESSETEFITVEASTLSACIAAVLPAARRYSRGSGKRDHIVTIEFWQRLT